MRTAPLSLPIAIAFLILSTGCVSPEVNLNMTAEINITGPLQLNLTEPANDTGFNLTGMDWKSKNCQLMANECEFRNAEFEGSCARLFYESDVNYLCHMYVNTRLIRDLGLQFYDDVPRIYNFTANLKTPRQYRLMELRNQTFHFSQDTEIRICCVTDDKNMTKKLEFRNYDVCDTIILNRLCDD